MSPGRRQACDATMQGTIPSRRQQQQLLACCTACWPSQGALIPHEGWQHSCVLQYDM